MSLKYHWKAIKDDDTVMLQYSGESENSFTDVITELIADNIKELQLIEQDGTTVYCVDLINYKFYKGTSSTPHDSDETPSGITGTGRASLIYKRRNQIRVNEQGSVVTPARTTYILGFKISDKSYTCDIRAAVGQLEEEYTSPRETSESSVE